MKKNFKEVIADIKDGEKYICTSNKDIIIYKDAIGIALAYKGLDPTTFYFDDVKDFEKVEKNVDFTEAFEAYKEGKTIGSKFSGRIFKYKQFKSDTFTTGEILGKWIIKEAE